MSVAQQSQSWLRRALPQGQRLPYDAWQSRHRAIVALLCAHAVAVPVIAVSRGLSASHAALESLILPVMTIAALAPSLNRRARTAAASLGLLSASGILVHLFDGLIEMHFHFFVMVGVVALYQDWVPFLTAIAYVLLHHGIVGVLDADSVYNHPDGQDHPWKWAAIHAGFIGAMSVGCLVTWRFNENTLADRDLAETRLREESQITDTLHRIGQALAEDLETQRVVQTVTDAATDAVAAEFGAFFYNAVSEAGDSYALYALSGAPMDAFEQFGLPRNTPVFGPTFEGEAPLRLDDVTKDPRFGQMAPHFGMPAGHLPVCSYLAVPVFARNGDVLGGLFFGHHRAAQFTAAHERIVVGVAAQASIAFDNARLYEAERHARTSAESAGARLAVLAEASKILNSSLEVESVLRDLTRVVVPAIADYCVLDLDAGDGSIDRIAAAATPERREWSTRIAADGAQSARSDPLAFVRTAIPEANFHATVELDPPTSAIAVPVIGREGTLGTLWLAAGARSRRRLTDADAPFAEELGRRVAVAVGNAQSFARQRSLAETLQHSLLPDRLPHIPGIEAAARYVAGGPGVEVGGDWYDVIQLPGGRIGLAIGDVVGKGEKAAALMGHLRSALRAYGTDGRSPAEVMERLNELLLNTGPDQMATTVYAVLDPESGLLTIANAGHPPPLLASPDGTATYLDDTRGMPIGALPGAHYVESTVTISPGSVLVMYTDGLVEDRTKSIDVGLERLRSAVAAGATDLDELCAAVLAQALSGRETHDDTAVLAVRLQLLTPELDLRIPANPNMLGPLRTTMRRWLADRGASDGESFELLVAAGELFTNAIRHGKGSPAEFDVHADVRDGVMISVRNLGGWRERLGEVGGRGLGMVGEYTDRVEIVRGESETEVRMYRRLAADAAS
ncbi:MAG TPA: SpoIIE family protein phosphatase [Mycobacteriales bacterium]|nr:SpoIIE family protein phosphatase [Mycobacteriales bacterium]